MRRLAAVAALVAALWAAGGGVAQAEAPLRVNDPITDRAAALGTDPSAVQAALDRLGKGSDIRLYLVFVNSFSGRTGQDWADRSAQASQLGRNEVLLAVATSDRAYGVSVDDRFPLSDQVLSDIENRDVRPRLATGDYAGAAVAMADGLRTGAAANGGAGTGGTGALVPVALVGGAAVLGGGAVLLVRRRRRPAPTGPPEPVPSSGPGAEWAPAPASGAEWAPPATSTATAADPAPGDATADLAYRASTALIALDDAVQTSEHELGLARTEFGDAAVAEFRQALDVSHGELVQAFALRQRIDDENPDDGARRALLGQIIALCGSADQRLDDQAAAFDRLRDLEQNAEQVVADLRPKLGAVTARVPGATAALDALRTRYAASAVEPVGENVTQATARLDLARTEVDEAAAEVAAGQRPAAAMSARAAEEAITQAGTLLDGVRRLADELAQAANRLVEARAEVEADLAEARLLPGDGLAAAAARAQAALTAAGRETETGADPLAALRRLDEAGTTLDQALADAHEERTAGDRAAAQLDRTLLSARSGIASASDFISTRRGAVGSDARTRLAEAQRHVDVAVGLGTRAPVDALREAQQADVLARQALELAQWDVQRWTPPDTGSRGGGIDWGGLVLSGIVLATRGGGQGGGGRGGGHHGGGGFSPGSFGGSGTRGRRGGGGRF